MSDDKPLFDQMLERGEEVPLDRLVAAFLDIGFLLPEKPPKRVRDQRDNEMLVQGYARAQETLRTILERYGYPTLAEHRHPESQRPMEMRGLGKVWVS